jgi:hypothetical protein
MKVAWPMVVEWNWPSGRQDHVQWTDDLDGKNPAKVMVEERGLERVTSRMAQGVRGDDERRSLGRKPLKLTKSASQMAWLDAMVAKPAAGRGEGRSPLPGNLLLSRGCQ